jgi:hypothetical protein
VHGKGSKFKRVAAVLTQEEDAWAGQHAHCNAQPAPLPTGQTTQQQAARKTPTNLQQRQAQQQYLRCKA